MEYGLTDETVGWGSSAGWVSDNSYSGHDGYDGSIGWSTSGTYDQIVNAECSGGVFAGFATWSQDGTSQDDDTQDALMMEACDDTFPGSRAATMLELTDGTITDLPTSNTSGYYLIGLCPYCEGDTAPTVEGTARNCVDPGSDFPSVVEPWPLEDYCYSSTRSVACVD